MRISYRSANNKDYWTRRWASIPSDHPMENTEAYPLKYALKTIEDREGKILEAGCGAGRILRFFHERGFDILGMDFVAVAVDKLKKTDPSLKAEEGDITNLSYPDGSFKYVLAFGLYHNIEHGLDRAVAETYRVLEVGGAVCASFRADNIQTRLTDWLADSKEITNRSKERNFHKLNLTLGEFKSLFEQAGFYVEATYPVQNMPLLYKFSLFRARKHKVFDETLARREGYLLSSVGRILQGILMKYFPNQFCNIYVLIARKNPRALQTE